MRPVLLGGLAAAAALALLSPPATAAEYHIVIDKLTYQNVPAAAHVGDVIEWVNKDFIAHTATARDGSFDVTLQPGKRARTRLGHAGKVAFYCRFHPNMKGEIAIAK